jgi:hypothetical protein
MRMLHATDSLYLVALRACWSPNSVDGSGASRASMLTEALYSAGFQYSTAQKIGELSALSNPLDLLFKCFSMVSRHACVHLLALGHSLSTQVKMPSHSIVCILGKTGQAGFGMTRERRSDASKIPWAPAKIFNQPWSVSLHRRAHAASLWMHLLVTS